MRYNQFIACVLLFLGLISASAHAQKLNVRTKTSQQFNYYLTAIQKMTFTSGNLYIMTNNGNADEYQLEDLRYLRFSDILTKIDEPHKAEVKSTFIIYPNPASNSVQMVATGNEILQGTMELVNSCGKVIKNQSVNGVKEVKVDLTDLSNGIFLFRFTDRNGVQTIKIVKR